MPKALFLNSKSLAALWHLHAIYPDDIKRPDGTFIFDSLFSVYCLATSKTLSAIKCFSHETCDHLQLMIKKNKAYITSKTVALHVLSENLFLRDFSPHFEYNLLFEPHKNTPLGSALVKLFMSYNTYFNLLDRLVFEGDISLTESKQTKKAAKQILIDTMSQLVETCQHFHRIRKESANQ